MAIPVRAKIKLRLQSRSLRRARGNVTMALSDAGVPPVINPNWLTDSMDIELAAAAFKWTRDFFNTTAKAHSHCS
ncbi:Glucose-methanol-choline oxidoreductase C-terminal [Penicillium crustosum]|uniref:Glucose-methanol-choline oxidoreductase C-terminal n=1 Tax=Penicillium crustosum TaxID=36656 RepID=UPI0023821A5A|nr:Glucose-methanol-choline oxidoreductase C-terminal [Penicillium crustosum]KAJ5393889.1 Glucose-methanol-choline oxidoreductase C-terminal [Penicillium crustosum]